MDLCSASVFNSLESLGHAITMLRPFYSLQVLGNTPQGLWMGLMTMAGSLARVVGPIAFALIYESFGTYMTFGLLGLIVAISGILVVVFWKRLVPKEA